MSAEVAVWVQTEDGQYLNTGHITRFRVVQRDDKWVIRADSNQSVSGDNVANAAGYVGPYDSAEEAEKALKAIVSSAGGLVHLAAGGKWDTF
jgi:hypothetical protein